MACEMYDERLVVLVLKLKGHYNDKYNPKEITIYYQESDYANYTFFGLPFAERLY